MVRFLLRLFFLIVFLGGLGGGIVYPSLGRSGAGFEIARWPVYNRATGFVPAQGTIGDANVPFRVLLAMRFDRPLVLSGGGAILTVTVSSAGETLLADAVNLAGLTTTLVDPQSAELQARAVVGTVETSASTPYVFTVGPGDAEQEKLLSAELILETETTQLSARAQPIGLAVMAFGFIGFILTWRRGDKPPSNPNSQPPPPKWGRAAKR